MLLGIISNQLILINATGHKQQPACTGYCCWLQTETSLYACYCYWAKTQTSLFCLLLLGINGNKFAYLLLLGISGNGFVQVTFITMAINSNRFMTFSCTGLVTVIAQGVYFALSTKYLRCSKSVLYLYRPLK